jgi:TRAP-type C4-dicarboxylate transport system permease small subunit
VSHGYEALDIPGVKAAPAPATPALPGALGALDRAMRAVNGAVVALGGVALVGACLVLTYSVIVRYILKIATDWQDETAVFLIVGATFLSGAAVQARRGHVGIEALATMLPHGANRVRFLLVDTASFLFCAFFSWKSWTLLHEAWLDDQHSSSTWAPPLWIPYSLMAVGMTLLALQILLQIVEEVFAPRIGVAGTPAKIGVAADLAPGGERR